MTIIEHWRFLHHRQTSHYLYFLKGRSYFWWLVSELYTINYHLIIWSRSLPFHLEVCHVSGVLHALNKTDPKKAPGPDCPDPFILQATAFVIAKHVAQMFTMSIGFNQAPVAWKQAYVTPWLKAGDRANTIGQFLTSLSLQKCWYLWLPTNCNCHSVSHGRYQRNLGQQTHLCVAVHRPYKGFWYCGSPITHFHLVQC